MHVCSFFCVLAHTSSNLVLQAGRCFNGGVNGGGFNSQNWILTEVKPQAAHERENFSALCWRASYPVIRVQDSPLSGAEAEAIVYVAVVDAVGVWVYRIPAQGASSWCFSSFLVTVTVTLLLSQTLKPYGRDYQGVSHQRKFKCVLILLYIAFAWGHNDVFASQAQPSVPPASVNPGNTSFAAAFTSNCQVVCAGLLRVCINGGDKARVWDDAVDQGCVFNHQQGTSCSACKSCKWIIRFLRVLR